MAHRGGQRPKAAMERALLSGEQPAVQPPEGFRGPMECPNWLPAGAKAIWEREAPRAVAVKPLDSSAFGMYCLYLYRVQELELDIEKRGFHFKRTRGRGEKAAANIKRNPAIQAAMQYGQAVRMWAIEFGATPASGTKLEIVATTATAVAKRERKSGVLNGEFLLSRNSAVN